MSKKQITKGQVGNALTSTAADHILAVADDVFDEDVQLYQSEINRSLKKGIDDVSQQMLSVVVRESSTSICDPLDLLLPLPPIDPEEPEPDIPDPTKSKLVWGVSKWGHATW